MHSIPIKSAILAGSIAVLLPMVSPAQSFLVPNNGDLVAGFRKTGANQANYEVVVNIGNITNLEALTPGTQLALGRYTPNPELVPDAFSDYNHLQWSVSGATKVFGAWDGFPNYTIWYTVPRTDASIQTVPPDRFTASEQSSIKQLILGIGIGAEYISSSEASNVDNTAFLVREPSGDTQHALSVYIADLNDPTIGDFNGTLPFTVEETTPASFGGAVRADLYQSCPSGTSDPITHQTSGSAYYVGYFQFNPDGTMTFTRAGGSITVPAPQITSVTRAGTTTAITFSTVAGATYSLVYAGATQLTSPVSSWATLPQSVAGDGTAKTLSDTSTDFLRYYKVIAH